MSDVPFEKPKRRPRYRGSHPRQFHEKYKELNPDRYAEDVAKIIASGKTPAGTHRSIMVREILEVLAPKPGDLAVDATLELFKIQNARIGSPTSAMSCLSWCRSHDVSVQNVVGAKAQIAHPEPITVSLLPET